jgi:hypothetical protein
VFPEIFIHPMMSNNSSPPDQFSPETMMVATRQQVSCGLGDEVVILSMESGAYFGLNPVAARIWELLQERRTIGSVRDILLEEYEGIDAEGCMRQLVDVLRQLVEWELLAIIPRQEA